MSEAFTTATSAASGKSCPKCGATIPPEAPQGLCPKCLLEQASFPTETGATTRHTRPAPPDRDELARAFPHLEILELIGQGGMGFVYKARQPKLDRLVALKILAQPLAEQTHFAERFTREGRTLAKLNHPNIVTIHDFGQAGPFFYLLMEYVDGVNLRQAMRAGAVNSTQALAIVPRICEALQYAHNEGVLHRDIKPDNILLDTRGRVKIADFGIAKLMAEAVAENPLTGSGASLGTPHYMAPEQIEKPNTVDHRADIYSLGVVFYEMLTGELPLGRFAAPSEKSAIDPRLDEVVFQTLEKQPERRPQSADEVKTKVETIAADPKTRSESTTQQPVTFKMSLCYLTTPEFLRTWIGRQLRFTRKGDLRLDEQNLTFSPPRRNWIVIPLGAITSLSLLEFPAWFAKRLRGLKLIAITFTEKNETHRLFFVPIQGEFRPIWDTNRHVEEWFGAIQNAVRARAGRIPPGSAADIEPLPISSSQPSEPFFATVAKAAVLMLILFSVVLIAMFGIYALLRARHQQANTPAIPEATAPIDASLSPPLVGPTKTLNLAFDYFGPDPKHDINLKARTDLAGNEQISTTIRYNDNDWSLTRFASGWRSDDRFLRLHWELPDNFSIPFDLEPAVNRFFNHRQTAPVQLSTNEPIALFTITNSLNQRITCGIRYDIAHTAADSVATLTNLIVGSLAGGLELWVQANVPATMMLIAYSESGGAPERTVVRRDMPNEKTIIYWSFPQDSMFPSITLSPQARSRTPLAPIFSPPFTNPSVEISTNPMPVFTLTNGVGKIFRAFIALAPASITNVNSIFVGQKLSPEPTTASLPVETLELTLLGRSVKPHKITIEAGGLVTLDENIAAVIAYPEADAQSNAPPRLDRGDPYMQNTWRSVRGTTNQDVAELTWKFSERFSTEGDLRPAVDRFFESAHPKSIRLVAGKTTSLFVLTNAFGDVADCGLSFTKAAPILRDSNAGVIITGAGGKGDYNGIVVGFSSAFPKGIGLQASGSFENKAGLAILTRSLQANGPFDVKWFFPEGFPVPTVKTFAEPSREIPLPQPADRERPPFLLPLLARIEAGDARITTSKPLEVFAITNSQGDVFRGFLQISYGK